MKCKKKQSYTFKHNNPDIKIVLQVRIFQPNDMFSVIKLANKSLTEQYSPSLFNYFYETFPQAFIVAEQHHKIIGFIVGVKITQDTARILMLAVSEKYRRQNIGSMLLNKFFEKTLEEHIKQISLEVRVGDEKAIKFYQKHGFKITDEIQKFYQNGEDAYLMRKK